MLVAMTGCSDDGRGSDGAQPARTPGPEDAASRLRVEVSYLPDPLVSFEDAQWTLTVSNGTDSDVTLEFATSQRGDVVLLDGDEERYRWSQGRAFTQVVGTSTVTAGATVDYVLNGVLEVGAGSYDLVAELVSNPAVPPTSTTVTVRQQGGGG